jgi:hypothetical protein
MPINAIYQYATDNVAGLGTLVATTADGAYPVANLVDLNPAKPAKLTGTTGNVRWDFAAAQRIDLAAIIHHNLTAGLNVRLQGNATDVWSAPTLDAAFTIPAYREDGYPSNPWIDLTLAAGYTATGFRYWRLVVVAANGANVAIGDVWLGMTKRTLTPNISWGETQTEERALIEHLTDFKVATIYDLGVTVRGLTGELDWTDSNRAIYDAWWRSCRGRVRPFLLIPNGTVNDAWLARFVEPEKAITLEFLDRNRIPVAVRELGRGLVL